MSHGDPRESHELRDAVGRVMVDFTQMKAFSEDPLVLTEGDGIRVRDVDGRWYVDGLSGTFCMSLGHGNERVIEAATSQLSRLALAAPTMAPARVPRTRLSDEFRSSPTLAPITSVAPNTLYNAYSFRPPSVSAYATTAASAILAQ